MSDPSSGRPPPVRTERLDSWKAIADYLGRDIRTVMRWETERNLPVRRVPGGRGRTVFAFPAEIDAWLANAPDEDRAPGRAIANGPRRTRLVRLVSALVLATAIAGPGAWWWWSTRVEARTSIARADADASGVTAWNAAHERLWFHAFPVDRQMKLTAEAAVVRDLDGDGRPEILVGVGQVVAAGHVDESGELLMLGAAGDTKWRFVSAERLRIGSSLFRGPWPIATWQVAPGPGPVRTAVAVHDFTWWPSIVYVLDDRGAVMGQFVNAGWIGSLAWIDTPQGRRLVAGGVSNSQGTGIVAVLDASGVKGRSPETAGSHFECQDCPNDDALAYFAFPRTELNTVMGSTFNQARVFASALGLTVRTEEVSPSVARGDGGIEVIYQFTPALDLDSATFGDRYWDLHRRLEQEGRIRHTRDQCPDRDGPREIRVWQPRIGWRNIALNRR